jgi:opacity protein-like surface antigen
VWAWAAALAIVPSLAAAQPAGRSAPAADRGYIEAVAQSAFGNVTSQSFGGEAGYGLRPDLQIFVEGGVVRDTAPAALGAAAGQIAGYLAQAQSNVGYRVKQPATFGVAGVRYLIPVSTPRAQPYVLGGFGVAQVKHDVTFTIAGSDVTATLPQYGVTLGSDLSGSSTRPMLSLGGGVAVPVWQQIVLDLQFRYGRIFTEDAGTNVGRAGIGLGFRF